MVEAGNEVLPPGVPRVDYDEASPSSSSTRLLSAVSVPGHSDTESPTSSGAEDGEFGSPYQRPHGQRAHQSPNFAQKREEAGARLIALAAQCRSRWYRHQPRRRSDRVDSKDNGEVRADRRSNSCPSMTMQSAAAAAAAASALASSVNLHDDAEAEEAAPGRYNGSLQLQATSMDNLPPSLGMSMSDTVIIFDWDDTLFPTWFITEVVLPCMPPEREDGHKKSRSKNDQPIPWDSPFAEALRQHAITLRDLLITACSIGRVGIVTLSQRPWVTSSARRYLLGVDFDALLKELRIPIIYARESIKRQVVCIAEVEEGVNVFAVAKQRAMQKALKKLYGKGSPWRNIISVGDANHERDAIKELLWGIDLPLQERPPCCKTVKLMEEPSAEQLGAELLLLGMWLKSMVEHEEDFDIVMDDSEETMLRMHEQFCS